MARRPARHAKIASRYEARHARPGGPGPAALSGAAARTVPAGLVAGVACSALALSGTPASAATTFPPGPAQAAADPGAVKPLAPHASARPALRATAQGRHDLAGPAAYTVAAGDTLSRISIRFCGTAADYPSLAAASGLASPDLIYPGQAIKLDCHHAPAASIRAPASSRARSVPAAPAPARPSQTVATSGMSAFEACVISRESSGNPRAVNPASDAGGLFQFLPSTWASLGYAAAYPGGAQTAPVSVQEAAFAKLYAESGTSPWAPYDGC